MKFFSWFPFVEFHGTILKHFLQGHDLRSGQQQVQAHLIYLFSTRFLAAPTTGY